MSDANTVGAYPLVTVVQARQRLAAGQHLSAWEPFPGEDRVKRVDLQYLARQTDRYFMPYYVFWVECDDGEQGVCYRPYYVPAVADAYIAACPKPHGRHNAAYRRFLGYGLLGYGLLDTHAIFTLIRAFFPKLQERPPAFAA